MQNPAIPMKPEQRPQSGSSLKVKTETVAKSLATDTVGAPERSSEEISAALEEKLQQFLLPETG